MFGDSTRSSTLPSPDTDGYRGEANIEESQSLLHPMVITSGSSVLEVMTDLIRTKVKFKPSQSFSTPSFKAEAWTLY